MPSSWTCRAFSIPDDVQYLALFKGAILDLIAQYNWEQLGGISAQDAAAAFLTVYNSYRGCKMIGEIFLWSAATSPDSRFLPCDGASLIRADYPDLFAVLGTTFGAVDSSHFNVPDLRGRVPIGIGSGTGLSTYGLGDTGGEETHTLVTGEAPSHSHSDSGHTHGEVTAIPTVGAAITGVPVPSAIPGAGVTGLGFAGLSTVGGDGAHNNIQPYVALNYLIVALP